MSSDLYVERRASMEGEMTSPRFMVVTVTFHECEDGGMRVSSADLPGLLLSGSDKEHVFKMIAPSIGALLKRKGIAPFMLNALFLWTKRLNAQRSHDDPSQAQQSGGSALQQAHPSFGLSGATY